MSQADTQTNKPVKTFRAGGVEASVWENESQQGDRKTILQSVSIWKQYRDKEGNWKESSTFFPKDMPHLILVAQKAFEFVALNKSKDADVPV